MTALARGDAERLLRFVAEAESFGGEHPFSGAFLTQLGRLVPADWVGYSQCAGRNRDGPNPNFERPGDEGFFERPGDEGFFSGIDWPAVTPVLDAENPVFLRFQEGSFEAVKISDFLTRRELQRTRLYGVVLGPCGLADELGIRLHIGPRRLKCLFIFDRCQGNFSDRDSAMLDALRPHLEQLLHAAHLRWRLREALALHEATQAAIVVLESDDRVVFVSTAARELLDRYFGEKGARLPDRLASWAAERRRAATDQPLRIDAGDRSLVAEFIDGALLLEERQRRPGLTAREREILDLVAEGRTNAEIAERLWVSPATVRKHLENVYAKLGVHTRTAAAAFVQEWRRPTGYRGQRLIGARPDDALS